MYSYFTNKSQYMTVCYRKKEMYTRYFKDWGRFLIACSKMGRYI